MNKLIEIDRDREIERSIHRSTLRSVIVRNKKIDK